LQGWGSAVPCCALLVKQLRTRCAGFPAKAAVQRLVRDDALAAQQKFVGKIAGKKVAARSLFFKTAIL
jgi:hypothetical protein